MKFKIRFFCNFLQSSDIIVVRLDDIEDTEIWDLKEKVYKQHETEFKGANVGISHLEFFALSPPVPKNPLKTIAERVIGAAAKDEDSDDFLDNGVQLNEHPEWQSLTDVSLFLRVKSDTLEEDAAERQDQYTPLVTLRKHPVDWFKNNYPKAPSSAADTSQFMKRQERPNEMIFCGRPYSAFQAVPPTLLCPQFSQFVIDLDSCIPSTLDMEHFHELYTQMSDIFIRELPRNIRFIEIMRKFGFPDLERKVIGEFYSDGGLDVYVTEVDQVVSYCILEVKNEIGKGTGEPMAQAALYWLEAIRLFTKERDDKIFSQTNFPAVLLLHYGSYISVALAVYAGTPNVQILNPVVPLHFHPSDTKARATGERFICALRRLLSNLKEYYMPDVFSESPLVQVKFPFYTTYTDGGASHPFVYEEQIDQKRVFSAHLRDNPEDKIFVKFSRRYGEDAHKAAHARDFAPRLRAVERFADGWVMVVMDDVSQQYCRIKGRRLKKNVYKAAQEALASLHADGYVHGDVRETNIMVKRGGVDSKGLGDIILVDFDWAGKENAVRYPSNITLDHPELRRPEGVDRGGLISSVHDDEMLEFLYL